MLRITTAPRTKTDTVKKNAKAVSEIVIRMKYREYGSFRSFIIESKEKVALWTNFEIQLLTSKN